MSSGEAEICSRLRQERVRLGLTASKVASIAGVSLSAYKRWEIDRSVPSGSLLVLAEAGFDVQYIVTGERLPAPGQVREPAALYGLAPADRAVYALRLVMDVAEEMGILKSLSAEQLQILVGYAHRWAPTHESMRAFIETAMRAGLGEMVDKA